MRKYCIRFNIHFLALVLLVLSTSLVAEGTDSDDTYAAILTMLDTDPNRAGVMAQKLIRVSVEAGDMAMAGKAAFVAASVYDDQQMLLNASMRYFEALQYLRRADVDVKSTEVSVLKNLGRINNLAGRIDAAIGYYEEALNLADDAKAKAGIVFNIGYAYYSQGAYDEALIRFFQAYEMSVDQDNYVRATNCLNYIGLCFHSVGNFEAAREYFYRILNTEEYLDSTGYRRAAGWAMHNIANAYFEDGDFEKALEKYLLCLDLKKKTGDSAELFVTLLDLGELKLTVGDTSLAIGFLEKAERIYPLKAAGPETFKVYDFLERAYDGRDYRKHRQALDRLKMEWMKYDDQMKRMKDNNLSYEMERIHLQVMDKIEEQDRIRFWRGVLIWGSPLLLTLLGGGMWWYQRRKIRIKRQLRDRVSDSIESTIQNI